MVTRGGVILITLLLFVLALPAAAQRPLSRSERVNAAPAPFLSPRSVAGRMAPGRLRAWVSAVYLHQPGQVDAASKPVWSWTRTDLADVLVTLDEVRNVLARSGMRNPNDAVHIGDWTVTMGELREMLGLTPAELLVADLSRLIKRAVILHTDIAAAASDASKHPDFAPTLEIPAIHFGVAMDLADSLRPAAGTEEARQGQDPGFVSAWYRAVAAFLQAKREITSAPVFLDRALELYRDDPSLLMMAGGVCELLASPRVQEGNDIERDADIGTRDGNLRRAEARYRRVLALEPKSPEARVRLGRVVGLLGRHQEALTTLTDARVSDGDREMRYYRALFLGDERDAVGNAAAARDAYTEALALFPAAQSSHLAMATFERKQGNREAASASVRGWLGGEARDSHDPWTNYYTAGDGRRAGELLAMLRDQVRRLQ